MIIIAPLILDYQYTYRLMLLHLSQATKKQVFLIADMTAVGGYYAAFVSRSNLQASHIQDATNRVIDENIDS